MSVLRDKGTTRLSIPALAAPQPTQDPFLEAVRETAADDFEVFGEIGRASDGTAAYLARDRGTDKLVVLQLSPCGGRENEFDLEVVRELRDEVPADTKFCVHCGGSLRQWGRFCSHCGKEIYGDFEEWTVDELRQAVKQFTRDRFEILGDMVAKGSRVYFARDLGSGKIEALRLEQREGDELALGYTSVLKPIVQGRPSAPRSVPPKVKPAPRRSPPQVAPRPVSPEPRSRAPVPRHENTSRPTEVDRWQRLVRDLAEEPVLIVALAGAAILLLIILVILVVG